MGGSVAKQLRNSGPTLDANDDAILAARLRLDGACGNNHPVAIGTLVPETPLSRSKQRGQGSATRWPIGTSKERVSELIEAAGARDLKLPAVLAEIGWCLCQMPPPFRARLYRNDENRLGGSNDGGVEEEYGDLGVRCGLWVRHSRPAARKRSERDERRDRATRSRNDPTMRLGRVRE